MIPTGRRRPVFLAGDPVEHTKGYAEYAASLEAAGMDAASLPLHVPAGRLKCLAGLRTDHGRSMMLAQVPLVLRYFFGPGRVL